MSEQFYVADLRETFVKRPSSHPFITFWGPDNSGYVYSLDRSGRYTFDELVPGYHYQNVYGSTRALLRFPVACAVVEKIARSVPAEMGTRWKDIRGPVLLNDGRTRSYLRRHRILIGDPSAFDKRATEPA